MRFDPVEAEGTTVEDAIEAALAKLGATEDEVEIKILAEGGPKGFLGRKVEPARVQVKRRDERTPEERAAGANGGELSDERLDELEDQADAAKEFVETLLEKMDFEGYVDAFLEGPRVIVEISGPEMGLLIGRRGMTLEALQDLTRAAVQRETETRPAITMDIEGYRERQEAGIRRRAKEAAQDVRRSKKAVTLDPMPSYQRKLVHHALADFQGVVTSSEGQEPNRSVVIKPA